MQRDPPGQGQVPGQQTQALGPPAAPSQCPPCRHLGLQILVIPQSRGPDMSHSPVPGAAWSVSPPRRPRGERKEGSTGAAGPSFNGGRAGPARTRVLALIGVGNLRPASSPGQTHEMENLNLHPNTTTRSKAPGRAGPSSLSPPTPHFHHNHVGQLVLPLLLSQDFGPFRETRQQTLSNPNTPSCRRSHRQGPPSPGSLL